MSKHFPNRRTFLSSASGTAVGLSLGQTAEAWERKPLDFSFLVVSDTHLGRKNNDQAERQWQRTAEELAKAKGDFVLHLGDVVDGGREEQYPKYLATRKKIGKPVYEIPGNHDPQPLFEKYLRRPVEMTLDHKGVRFLLLNNSRTDSHDGFLSQPQLAWIDRQCAGAAELHMPVFLCMHVTAHGNRHPDRGWYVKPKEGQTAFYELLAKHRETIVATFHGHFHNGIRGWDDHASVHEIIFPSALYNLDRKLVEQKAPGYNLKEFRPGYVLATVRDGQLTLQYKPLNAEASVSKRITVAAK